MNRILIATHFFYPTITPRAFRATELADELIDRGFEVDILIGEKERLIKNYSKDTKKELKDIRSNKEKKIKISKSKILVSKVLVALFGETNILKKRKFFHENKILNEYDSIISIGPPFYTHFFISKEIKKCCWKGVSITDWGDPFYASGDSHYMLPHMKYVQSKVLNEFDYLTIPVKEAKNYYIDYIGIDKIKIIPQGFKFNNELPVDVELFFEKNGPTFMYAGAFYKQVRDPEKILKYLSELNQMFTFVLFTDLEGTIYEEVLLPYKKILGRKLILHDKVDRDELFKYFKHSDFLLNIENISSNQVPSKLIDLALSEKPILSINPEKIDSIKFTEFLQGNYEQQIRLDLSDYDIENVTDKFVSLMCKENNNE